MSAALTRGSGDAAALSAAQQPARPLATPGPWRAIAGIAWADWLERVRTTRFLITLGAMLALGWYFLPPNGAQYATMQIGGNRGVYNSPWIGALIGLLANTFLSLIGFYLVKNSIERDRSTGVGQVLAAAPLSTRAYLLGKWLSNCAVLFTMIAALTVSAGIMQAVRAESLVFDPPALIVTMMLLTLPVMALVAALAVFFETIPGLRGSVGNVVYFFVWISFLSTAAMEMRGTGPRLDVIGGSAVVPAMKQATLEAFPGVPGKGDQMSLGINIREKGERWNLGTFEWKGVTWTAPMVASRLFWLLPALLLLAFGAKVFDRFDTGAPVPAPSRARKGTPATGNGNGVVGAQPGAAGAIAFLSAAPTLNHHRSVASLALAHPGPAFFVLLRAELALLLRGSGWWWYGLVGVLAVLCTVLPLDAARFPMLPLLWVLSLLRWSPLGTRERTFDTAPVLFSAPSPVLRQLGATWLAGALLALLPSLGLLLRLAIAGDGGAVAGVLAGAAFVPALALACGIWTHSPKLFEVVFLTMWYAILNRVSAIDFMAATRESVAGGAPLRFAILTVALLVVAAWGRAREVRN